MTSMYRAVYDGNYAGAYKYRSQRCRGEYSEAQYAESLNQAIGGERHPGVDVEFKIRYLDPRTAYVDVQAPSASSHIGGERKWTRSESGHWEFDNC